MKHQKPEAENASLEAALRAVLDPTAAPPLDPGFAAKVAARAAAQEGGGTQAGRLTPRARFLGSRWAWSTVAAVIVLLAVWGGRRWQSPPPAPQTSQAAIRQTDRAEQVRQLRYAIAFTRAEIASITGEAVRPSLRNLSAQISRSQP